MKARRLGIQKFIPRKTVKKVYSGDEDHARCPVCGYVTFSFNGLIDNWDGTWSCVNCNSEVPVHPGFFSKALNNDDVPGFR